MVCDFGYKLGKEGEKMTRTFSIFLGLHTNTEKELGDFRILLAYCRQIAVNIFKVEAYLSQFKINISELLANSHVYISYFVDHLRNLSLLIE